jgi:hypothetical protein
MSPRGCTQLHLQAGSLFFAMDFGDEGGSPVKAWIYRCCVIQGTQPIYVLALWFWGDYITKLTSRGSAINTSTTDMTIVMCPIAGPPIHHRAFHFHRPPRLLPTGSRPSALLLQLPFPPPHRRLVLGCRHTPKSHPVFIVWPEWGISMILQPCQSRANSRPYPWLVHPRLGRDPLPLQPPLKDPHLDPTNLRHRPRRATLGSDPLALQQHRLLPPLGGLCALHQPSSVAHCGSGSASLMLCNVSDLV